MVVGQSEALAERPGPNFGVVVGGDGGIACALGKTERGKSACGRAFCGGDPEEAGTSMAFAGRGGNDEGAKHDAL